MFDPAAISLADLFQAWMSPAIVIFVGAVLLLLCEWAILLGLLISHLREGSEKNGGGHFRNG